MIPFPNRKYNIIYADPPWSIQVTSQVPSGRPNTRPYRAMRQIDIFNLPVSDISQKDSTLFLWATSPLLPEAIFTIRQWGFEYKSVAFTWIKKNRKADSLFWGMGWWTRSNSEFCLLGTRGEPKRKSAKVHSVLIEPIEKHSKKPAVIKEKIIELCGDLPRLELFARQKTVGWDTWGDEI